MKTLHIEDDVHLRLTMRKATTDKKSFNDCIESLLDEVGA